MNGAVTLKNELLNSTEITDLVSSVGVYPCIAWGLIAPKTWGVDLTIIFIYRLNPVDYTEEAMFVDYVVNCRANKEFDAETLANAVISVLNRKAITGGGRFYCQKGAVIQPSDNTDNFNLPVTVRVKSTFDLD
jgi:hypothetical protein